MVIVGRSLPWVVIGAAVAITPAGATAQPDLRDTVTLDTGRVVHGRVLERYEPDEVLLVQGGKRVHLPHAQVRSMVTVRDRLRELLDRRAKLDQNLRYRWVLAEWANANQLPALARVLALDVLLADDAHEAAHRLLGHRQHGDRWLWPLGDRWVARSELDAYESDWGHPLVLASEHFVIRSDAGLRRTIDALFDLEREYLWLLDTFGQELKLHEVIAPMELLIWKSVDHFPGWTSLRIPYFRPRVLNDAPSQGFTYYEAGADRARNLFEVAAQHVLYSSLAVDPAFGSIKDRLCAWAEIGFGQWVQSNFEGPAGKVGLVEPRFDHEQAQLVMTRRYYGLEVLTHRQARQFYITVASTTPVDWASAHMFVAWLMSDERKGTRAAFLAYLYEALRKSRGDSSTVLDQALGRPVETLEAPWRQWLARKLAAPPSRQPLVPRR